MEILLIILYLIFSPLLVVVVVSAVCSYVKETTALIKLAFGKAELHGEKQEV